MKYCEANGQTYKELKKLRYKFSLEYFETRNTDLFQMPYFGINEEQKEYFPLQEYYAKRGEKIKLENLKDL